MLAIALAGNRLPRRAAGYLATTSTAVSFIAAIVAFAATLDSHASDRETVSTAFGWVETHALSFKLALLVDPRREIKRRSKNCGGDGEGKDGSPPTRG